MGRQKHELAVFEVGGLNLGGKFRGQELIAEFSERSDFERFGDNWLQIVVGREEAADLGESHGATR